MLNALEIITIAFAFFFYATLIIKQHIAYRVVKSKVLASRRRLPGRLCSQSRLHWVQHQLREQNRHGLQLALSHFDDDGHRRIAGSAAGEKAGAAAADDQFLDELYRRTHAGRRIGVAPNQ